MSRMFYNDRGNKNVLTCFICECGRYKIRKCGGEGGVEQWMGPPFDCHTFTSFTGVYSDETIIRAQ